MRVDLSLRNVGAQKGLLTRTTGKGRFTNLCNDVNRSMLLRLELEVLLFQAHAHLIGWRITRRSQANSLLRTIRCLILIEVSWDSST